MKTAHLRGICLKVAMARQIRTALDNAKVLKCLDGPQRQRFDDTIERLEDIIGIEKDDAEVALPVNLVVAPDAVSGHGIRCAGRSHDSNPGRAQASVAKGLF